MNDSAQQIKIKTFLQESSTEVSRLLTQWVGKKVVVKSPKIEFLEPQAIYELLEKLSWDVGGFAEVQNSNVKGLIVQLMTKNDALEIVNFVKHGQNLSSGIGTKEISALNETLNIISGAYVNKFVELSGIELQLEPPHWLAEKVVLSLVKSIKKLENEETTVMVLESIFELESSTVNIPVIIVLNNFFVSMIIKKGE